MPRTTRMKWTRKRRSWPKNGGGPWTDLGSSSLMSTDILMNCTLPYNLQSFLEVPLAFYNGCIQAHLSCDQSSNQRYFSRSFIPSMLGWFLVRSASDQFEAKSPDEIEWVLSKAAGFNAGFALVADMKALERNETSSRYLRPCASGRERDKSAPSHQNSGNGWRSRKATGIWNQLVKTSGTYIQSIFLNHSYATQLSCNQGGGRLTDMRINSWSLRCASFLRMVTTTLQLNNLRSIRMVYIWRLIRKSSRTNISFVIAAASVKFRSKLESTKNRTGFCRCTNLTDWWTTAIVQLQVRRRSEASSQRQSDDLGRKGRSSNLSDSA